MKDQIKNYLSVFVFACLGGSCRFGLNSLYDYWGTLSCNLLGCFLLAFLTYFALEWGKFPAWMTVGLGTGFVGAFTTFSSFNLDTLKLLLTGSNAAWLYWLVSMILGFLLAFLGARCGQKVGAKI
jgi:CrcB protein